MGVFTLNRIVFLVISGLLAPTYVNAQTANWQKTVTLEAGASDVEGLQIVQPVAGSLRPQIQAMATVMENIGRSVAIRPAGDGKVSTVWVIPGDHVVAGQSLVTYVDHSLHIVQLQLAQARADLASAKARLADAGLAYRRGKTLSGSTVSIGEVARRLSVMQEAQNAVRFQLAAIDTLNHRLEEEFTSSTEKIVQEENSILIAPFDGIVDQLNTSVADDIATTDVIIRIISPSSVWIVASVRPEDVSRLSIGGQMHFVPLGANLREARTATIQTIDGTANPDTGLIKVIATFSDPTRALRPGTQLNAWLAAKEQANGLIVPTAALQNIDGQTVVYRKTKDNQFEPVPVRLLLENADQSVISGQLTSTDKIVAEGSFSLKAMALLSGLGGD
ncbi:MAG: efflux RND transporter periplasmic adaptor subunit [Gluconobacter cerinus]|uniref:efflux RND transporter periplasmic adaptor subunit n=1 Tax=Gluconobacter cerinus TaxID=38307 RepID=UPI0039E8E915